MAFAGFAVFYYGSDQYNAGAVTTLSMEHFGFILFVGGLVILVVFLILLFVIRARVNRRQQLPVPQSAGMSAGPVVTPYGGAGYGPLYAPVTLQQATNGMAIASMVLGILGGWLLALVFGYIALSQIKRRNENGRGMAIAGVVLG